MSYNVFVPVAIAYYCYDVYDYCSLYLQFVVILFHRINDNLQAFKFIV